MKKMKNEKERSRRRRHLSIRRKVVGTPEHPRVCVFRSNTHIYAQIVDDTRGITLAAVSSLKLGPVSAPSGEAGGEKKKGKGKKAAPPAGRQVATAREVGRMLAEAAKAKGIKRVKFDRGGYIYHGRVAALADGARANGLEF